MPHQLWLIYLLLSLILYIIRRFYSAYCVETGCYGMELYLKSWASWMPEYDESAANAAQAGHAQPELPQVPAMARRRLSSLTKMAFNVALKATDIQAQLPTIFASRHGDLHKTLGLLQQLAAGEALSPTHFALSVHNAISGQLSLFQINQADSNAIAGGADSLHYAVLEAAARLHTEPDLQEILIVYADEPVPDVYQSFCQDPSVAIALALLLSKVEGEKLEFDALSDPNCAASTDQALQLLAFLRKDCTELDIDGSQRRWCWRYS